MAAEFYVSFTDPGWLASNVEAVTEKIVSLPTFVQRREDEFWLKGVESRDAHGAWEYDLRIILHAGSKILLEISLHPPSVERDLEALLTWLRGWTTVSVLDEDGEPTNW